MRDKSLRIICVGKIKAEYWREAVEHYRKLLEKWRKLEIIEIRDGDACLSIVDRVAIESRRIEEYINNKEECIILDEGGEKMTSGEFATFLRNKDEKEHKRLNFIIGGPFGLDNSFKSQYSWHISLSSMTLPHELARVILLEQLFRAESIIHNFPYHH